MNKEQNSDNPQSQQLNIADVSGCLIGSDMPYRIAMKDISEYLHSQNLQIVDENGDVWVVTPARMANKETRKLNIELGLHKVNKYGNRMARFK